MGGAQAVAMLAYGIDLPDGGACEPVDLVTGPGNIYVTAAKRALQGIIGIDAEAGPTEVAILADDSADARYVAADLISQARARRDRPRPSLSPQASVWPTRSNGKWRPRLLTPSMWSASPKP